MAPKEEVPADYIDRLTIHGSTDIIKSQNRAQQGFWIGLFIGAALLMILSLCGNLTNFVDSPILTSYSIKPKAIDFPEIYICPMNPINNEALESKNQDGIWGEMFLKSAQDGTMLGKVNKIWHKTNKLPSSRKSNDDGFYGESQRKPAMKPDDMSVYFKHVSFGISEFFNQCSFQQTEFDCEKFITKLFDKDYGLCYLVQVKEKQDVQSAGLQIVLDLHSDKTTYETFLNGVLVRIEKTHDPSLISNELHAVAGEMTKISLDATKMSLINFKSRKFEQKCLEKKEIDKFPYKVLQSMAYTESSCRMDCIQQIVNEQCACSLAIDTKYLKKEFKKHCDSEKVQECYLEKVMVDKNLLNQAADCTKRCLEPCESWTFTPQVSTIDFVDKASKTEQGTNLPHEFLNQPPPRPVHVNPDFLLSPRPTPDLEIGDFTPGNLNRRKRSEPNESKSYDETRLQDYVILDISLDEIQYQEFSQSLSVSRDTFLSNLGGQMGLWLGASILSVVQLVTLLVLCCQSARKKRKKSAPPAPIKKKVTDDDFVPAYPVLPTPVSEAERRLSTVS